jgi:hypothetical protein
MAKLNTPPDLFVALRSNVMRREEKLADESPRGSPPLRDP